MSANLSALLYLVAGVLFILSLRGLSSPATSRRGNLLGMIGMAIAVATTLANHPPADGLAWLLVIVGIAIGAAIGAVIARRVPMTSMPELVAAFHSLVGMAAVLVAAGAFYAPEAFDIGTRRAITAPIVAPMAMPMMTSSQARPSAGGWLASVVATAIAMPIMPSKLPRRDVAGLDNPRSDRMNSTPATRYKNADRLALISGPHSPLHPEVPLTSTSSCTSPACAG